MTTFQPLGWSSSKMNMHFKAVYPQRSGGGMQVNLHKNVTKHLLPKEINVEETRNVDMARRILYRQRIGAKIFVGGPGKTKNFLQEWRSLNSRAKSRPDTTPEMKISTDEKTFLPSVFTKFNYPSTPCSRYSADDISRLVNRLSKRDPEKIPTSKGYPKTYPTSILYKKKYSNDEIDAIVRRLSQCDETRYSSDSRGATPIVVRSVPRQTMTRVKKSSSEEVQKVVEHLTKFEKVEDIPESGSRMESLD